MSSLERNLANRLGPSLFLLFLKEWLFLEEICALDGAYCSHHMRSNFLNRSYSQSSEPIIVKPKGQYLSCSALEWISLRRISVGKVLIHNCNFQRSELSVRKRPSMNQIKTLAISNITRNSVEQLNLFLTTCVCLTDLSLTYSKYVNDVSIEIVAKSNPSLTSVDFTGLIHITSRSLEALAASCPHITSLNVSECSGISEKVVMYYLSQNTNLQSLNISSASFVCRFETTVASTIAMNCKQLHTLDMSRAWCVNIQEMKYILQNCTELTDLNIYACHGLISSEVVDSIADHCKELVRLDIGLQHSRGVAFPATHGISDSAMVNFVKSCTKVTDLDISNITHMFTTDTLLAVANTLQLQRIVCREDNNHEIIPPPKLDHSPHKVLILFLATFSSVIKLDFVSGEIQGVPKQHVQHSFECVCSPSGSGSQYSRVFHTHRLVSLGSESSDIILRDTAEYKRCVSGDAPPPVVTSGTLCTDLYYHLKVDVLSSLTVLNLVCDTLNVTSDCLSHIAKHCTKLTEFGLYWCANQVTPGLTDLLTANSGITSLTICNRYFGSNSRDNALNGAFYHRVSHLLPGLRSLVLFNCQSLTCGGITDIIMACKKSLNKLSLTTCRGVDIGTVYRAVRRSGNKYLLENFSVNGTCSGDNLEHFATLYPVGDEDKASAEFGLKSCVGCIVM